MPTEYSPKTSNSYADWGGGDTGPRQFKHRKADKTWDDGTKPHSGSGKPRKDYQHATEQGDVVAQPDGELSIFAGDETLAKEIENKDGRSGEAIGEREVQGAVDSEAAVGVVIQPELASSSVQVPSMPPAQRRAEVRRIKRGKSGKQATATASTVDAKAVDLDSMQPATYSDDSTFGPYESPATYSDDQAFGPGEYPATYSDSQTFGPYASPATYSGDQTFGPYESPATYSDDQLFGPNDYPATYNNSQPFGPYESPATYSDDTTFGPYESPATYKDSQIFGADDAHARVNRNVERHQEKIEEYSELSREALIKRSRGRLFEADGRVFRGAIKAEDIARRALAKLTKGRLEKPVEGFFQKKNRSIHEADDGLAGTLQMLDRFTMAFDNSLMQKFKLEGADDIEAANKLAEHQQNRALQQDARKRSDLTGGKVAYWMDKYANLPTRKKVLFSLGAGATLMAAGSVFVAAGGVATLAGAAGLGVAKVVKTYGQTRSNLLKAGPEVSVPTLADSESGYKFSAREQIIAARDYTQHERAKGIKAADRNKKIATGLAAIATVPLVGGIVHKFVDFGGDLANIISDHAPSGIHQPSGILDSQGGGSGAGHVAKLGSSDVYQRPTIDIAPPPSHDVFVPQDLGGATEFNDAGLGHFNQWVSGHTVQPGESVWKLSQDYLQANGVKNPSVYQIDAVKDSVLAEFSAKGLVDSNGWLMAGDQL